MGFLSWMEGTAYSEWIVAGLLGWPLMLSMHALGLAAVVGIMFAISLRMLGFFKPIPYAGLGPLLAYGWIGIAVNAFSGLSLFMAQATFYVTSIPFLVKITFVILGIVNLHLTQRVLASGSRRLAGVGHGVADGNRACDQFDRFLDTCRRLWTADRLPVTRRRRRDPTHPTLVGRLPESPLLAVVAAAVADFQRQIADQVYRVAAAAVSAGSFTHSHAVSRRRQ